MESDAHVKLKPRYLFIRPVSVDVLEKRLISRGTDSLQQIMDRVETASLELEVGAQLPFDGVIVNDHLETAYQELRAFVSEDRVNCNACRTKNKQ